MVYTQVAVLALAFFGLASAGNIGLGGVALASPLGGVVGLNTLGGVGLINPGIVGLNSGIVGLNSGIVGLNHGIVGLNSGIVGLNTLGSNTVLHGGLGQIGVVNNVAAGQTISIPGAVQFAHNTGPITGRINGLNGLVSRAGIIGGQVGVAHKVLLG